ncbi:MAG: aspartate ammonia-lyase [Bacteroidales bacterium]|nr:aspartate ammonia-lyase [Bacteroidales bacterium]MBD5223343.1 aspartate ammonia-lyase [Bacteroidales bacterium]MBD5301421.1 aspartate ammonia-lyase [Bacteroides sp.]
MKDNEKTDVRIESDLLGSIEVPETALYGVQTLRGVENFEISKFKLYDYPEFVKGLAITKLGAAMANHEMGLLPDDMYEAIAQACREIIGGEHHEQFPVDMIQGGAGTSTNMNANEVIANRALEIMGHKRGEYQYCSPNDHVNRSQSTNDAYPTAIHIGMYLANIRLKKHFEKLIEAFRAKGEEFKNIIKMGRTQLEDAVPMTLGQTFNGFASVLQDEIKHLDEAAADFLTVNMGATAIGTGICAEPGYAEKCVAALSEITGWNMQLADDLVGITSDTSAMVGYSSALKRLATKVSKISNDLRLLASGPRCGLGEINLPARQPGSSIMPGKVNPVIPEVMSQICFKVIGNDVCVTMASEAAQMELNAMEPVTAQCNFESVDILINGFETLRTRCVEGITANEEKCRSYVHNSIGVVTALNPIIGYKNSTKIAKEAMETGRSVYDLVLEHGILDKEDLDTILAPENMIKPVKLDIKPKK